jgi:ankyrin repeat protein
LSLSILQRIEVSIYLILRLSYTLDYQDTSGCTALHYCALKNRIESMKILLKANLDHSLKNNDGQTAYEIAYKLMNFDCAKLIKQLISTNRIEDVEWIGCFDEDYVSDTNDDDTDMVSMRAVRPTSMISREWFDSSQQRKLVSHTVDFISSQQFYISSKR